MVRKTWAKKMWASTEKYWAVLGFTPGHYEVIEQEGWEPPLWNKIVQSRHLFYHFNVRIHAWIHATAPDLAQHRGNHLQHFHASPISRRSTYYFSARIISLKASPERKRQTYDSYSKECYQPFQLLVSFWEVNFNCIYIHASLSISRIGFLVLLVTSVSLAEERKLSSSSHGKWAVSIFLQWEFDHLEKFLGSVCVDRLWHWLSKGAPSNPYFIGENKIPMAQCQMVNWGGQQFPVSLQFLCSCSLSQSAGHCQSSVYIPRQNKGIWIQIFDLSITVSIRESLNAAITWRCW